MVHLKGKSRDRARASLSHRVFITILVLSFVLVMVITAGTTTFLQGRLSALTHTEIANQTSIIATALEGTPDDRMMIKRFGDLEGTRITLIDADGTVIYDNEEDAEKLANHLERPEVAQALATGEGSAERPSDTLGETMFYEARLLDNGTVLRLAQSQQTVVSIFASMVWPIVVLGIVCVLIASAVARRASARIIAPLTEVDLDHPVRNVENAYSEMVPMLERIESQRRELKRQVRVLADNDQIRREFTANITHELKTPLTAISGYAELIASGMVSDEGDLRDFGSRIHHEAGRLTSLVNDILMLSTLDEAEKESGPGASEVLGATEPVDLPRLIQGIAQRLEPVAAKADVTISVGAMSAMVMGVARLLDELVYNLASNAIRYNKPGGSVTLRCGTEEGRPFICVQDTGIGIAREEQDKVFERFYRVDKSRSKARGGTGLGLAIVKHAAMFHAATIEVESELGTGTTMTVRFPEQQLPPSGE